MGNDAIFELRLRKSGFGLSMIVGVPAAPVRQMTRPGIAAEPGFIA
jgi:hypothetical protein